MPSGEGALSFIVLLFIVIGSFFSVRSTSTAAFVLEPFLPVEHRSYTRVFKISSTKGKLRRLQKVNRHFMRLNLIHKIDITFTILTNKAIPVSAVSTNIGDQTWDK